jgi:hypothetical protein
VKASYWEFIKSFKVINYYKLRNCERVTYSKNNRIYITVQKKLKEYIDRIPKIILKSQPKGNRSLGRPLQ